MKIVKKSISIPEDALKFAKRKAAKISRETGEPENLSSYVRQLIQKDREREEAPELPQAA